MPTIRIPPVLRPSVGGEREVQADGVTVGEVLEGMAPGRTSEDEITCFKSLGIAIEDLAAAELAIATAESQSIGTVAPW